MLTQSIRNPQRKQLISHTLRPKITPALVVGKTRASVNTLCQLEHGVTQQIFYFSTSLRQFRIYHTRFLAQNASELRPQCVPQMRFGALRSQHLIFRALPRGNSQSLPVTGLQTLVVDIKALFTLECQQKPWKEITLISSPDHSNSSGNSQDQFVLLTRGPTPSWFRLVGEREATSMSLVVLQNQNDF